MGVFVQLATVTSFSGKFDEKKDTDKINKMLSALQQKGARIIGVTPAVGGTTTAVYVITYEANHSIAL